MVGIYLHRTAITRNGHKLVYASKEEEKNQHCNLQIYMQKNAQNKMCT